MNYSDCTTIDQVNTIRKAEKNAAHRVMRDKLGETLPEFKAATKRVEAALDKPARAMVSDWRKGETIYFGRKMSKAEMALFEPGVPMHNSVDCDQATFYHYQPKKKLVWLRFDKIVNSTYRDNLLPFTLSEVRDWGMKRTDV